MPNTLYLGLTKEEEEAIDYLLEFIKYDKNGIRLSAIYDFMQENNKVHGLFDNCIALVKDTDILVQRIIGWDGKNQDEESES